MGETRFDVVGIGNAMVDSIAQIDDSFLVRESIAKGTVTLVDAARMAALRSKIGQTTLMSGGSAANTMAALAQLGGRAAYIGQVYDDSLGTLFRTDLQKLRVHFTTPLATTGLPTGCCLVLVTQDGERSMNTFLGACTDLTVAAIDPEIVGDAAITYLEGYLFDKPAAKDAFRAASQTARQHRRKVALSLSDPFCVHRHRADFQAFIKSDVALLFANQAEAIALFETSDLETALEKIAATCPLAAVTLSEQGSIILHQGQRIAIPAQPPRQLLDTTGAGDLYAAGFLYGYTQNLPLPQCGHLAALCAAEVIAQIGPRCPPGLGERVLAKLTRL